MILVILNHVAAYDLGINTACDNNYHYYFGLFRMPLFFFVSGFLFYKSNYIWNIKNIGSFLNKKIFVQIISPLLFLLCYIEFRDIPLLEAITHPTKKGYWFTFALFNYFVLYIAIKKVLDTIKIRERTSLVILLSIGTILYYINANTILLKLNIPESILDVLTIKQSHFFIFFVLGACAKRYIKKFENALTDSYLLAIAILLFFTLNIFVSITWTEMSGIEKLIIKTLRITLAVCGIAITFGFFKKQENFFSKENRTANILKFIGKRTLDIYLLHYFFLSRNLPDIFPFFTEHNMPILEFAASLILTAIVISACLFTSSILRINSTLSHYLFGTKKV